MADPQKYVVLDQAGAIVNIVFWDGETLWHPGEGFTVRPFQEGDAMPAIASPVIASPRGVFSGMVDFFTGRR